MRGRAIIERPLLPVKNQFFDGITAFCLSSFGLPGGKKHAEPAPYGAIRCVGKADAAGFHGLRAAALNDPKGFFDMPKGPRNHRAALFCV